MTKTILVVDDCETLRWVMRQILRKAGYEVIEACDGEDALSKLDGRQVHLIVSDLNMPQMDGISLLKTVGLSSAHQSTPAIIFSSDTRDEKIKEGLAAGASVWLSKPLNSTKMLASISQLLGRGEGGQGMHGAGKSAARSSKERQQ